LHGLNRFALPRWAPRMKKDGVPLLTHRLERVPELDAAK
jgi:hypothetical protein